MAKQKWLVRLGDQEWMRHTYARAGDDPLRLIGSVRRGPQVGALAITPDGHYVQVVGDFLTPLNTGQLNKAIARAGHFEARAQPQRSPRVAPAPVPVPVVIKRRRFYVAA